LLEHVRISFESSDKKTSGIRTTQKDGSYSLPLLPPGTYHLRAEYDSYQPKEFEEIALAVAAFLGVDFDLRPVSDVFEQDIRSNFYFPASQRELNFYGPDIDTSRSQLLTPLQEREGRLTISISDVIDPLQVEELPLTGRDIYSALLLQPGVNADPGVTRGLGFSVNGQRPSSSSFLLDGVETNAYLISGPLLTPAPEMIQEYRVSTNNFSAEFGGTTGYIANAVTRAGGNRWHGLLYFFLSNDALNANSFQENLNGYPRAPLKQIEPGFRVEGPAGKRKILGRRLFTSNSAEFLGVRTRLDPSSWTLPTAATFQDPGTGIGANLLREYRPVASPSGPAGEALPIHLSAPSSLNQYLGISRLDAETPDGLHHLLLRAAVSRFDRPDYYWTPYTAFTSGFSQNTLNIAGGTVDQITERVVNEARVAWGSDLLLIDHNNNGLPDLSTALTACSPGSLCLPSSVSPFAYRNAGHAEQISDNVTVLRAHHTIKFGGGWLDRQLSGYLRNGADGSIVFGSLASFLADEPDSFTITVDRQASGFAIPDYNRDYAYRQFNFFAQDSWRIGQRLALNFGVRYEYFGSPFNTGSQKDSLIALGSGSNILGTLASASIQPAGPGAQRLYDADPHDWAPRVGVSWSPWKNLPVLLRGSYGLFYDRPFDNLWLTVQNNPLLSAGVVFPDGPSNYLSQVAAGLRNFPGIVPASGTFQPTVFQPGLRNGMVQSAFTGMQVRINPHITLDLNALASRGRGLLTTDFINRNFSLTPNPPQNPFGNLNPSLPTLSYRANQGSSNYTAATAVLKWSSPKVSAQVSYSLSHSMDNQSDPIAGDYNLESTSVAGGGAFYGRAAFVQQFNSAADWGNSDFDQRQNLVFFVIASLPAPRGDRWMARMLQDWRFAGLGSFRSGLPFNAYAVNPSGSDSTLIDDRANLVDPAHAYTRQPIPGGELILNPDAFALPAPGQLGTAGRNRFQGPGTISANLTVSRSFHIPGMPESVRLVVRADAYNFLNHANLYVDSENPFLPSPLFGTAQYGTTGVQTNFPVQVPLTATPRIIQLGARFEF
jgi:hypothetical protein